MIKKEITFPSRDGKSQIHAVRDLPENGPVKAVVQICPISD